VESQPSLAYTELPFCNHWGPFSRVLQYQYLPLFCRGDRRAVGAKILKLRTSKGWSQDEFADGFDTLAACPRYDEPRNPVTFPAPVPEIPAANVDQTAAYYVGTLGFTLDWGDDQGGIAGISRGNCRLFITNRSFREFYGNVGPVLFWPNLDSKAEVDELFAQWKAAQAKIVSEPEDKPWKLREFMAADPDGNLIRVFYDFRGDV
jgi:uncharacterized glyoxalase superfamily protein PhnB